MDCPDGRAAPPLRRFVADESALLHRKITQKIHEKLRRRGAGERTQPKGADGPTWDRRCPGEAPPVAEGQFDDAPSGDDGGGGLGDDVSSDASDEGGEWGATDAAHAASDGGTGDEAGGALGLEPKERARENEVQSRTAKAWAKKERRVAASAALVGPGTTMSGAEAKETGTVDPSHRDGESQETMQLGTKFDSTPRQRGRKSFEERLEDMKAYKAKHGHVKVKKSDDASLAKFCSTARRSRKYPDRGRIRLTAERTASLDALGFEWATRRRAKSFDERLEELKAYTATHGHAHVTESDDAGLAKFCSTARRSRRYPDRVGRMKLTEERTAALDALGFDWTALQEKKSFEERVEDLKAYKAEHGHTNVTHGEDRGLAVFCANSRNGRRNWSSVKKLTASRIAALDALGFDWAPGNSERTSFEERLEDLKAYKAKHGHPNVHRSEDKGLAQFCATARVERRHPGSCNTKMTVERIAALDALGFDWAAPQEIKFLRGKIGARS